jgi:NAD(P)-dependent dehydrogenase (short-subunit alcohol dehydrogenase family)
MTWAVNVLAPHLLTSLLLPLLGDHIVNVSSISAASSLDWGNLQQQRGYRCAAPRLPSCLNRPRAPAWRPATVQRPASPPRLLNHYACLCPRAARTPPTPSPSCATRSRRCGWRGCWSRAASG